MFKSSFKTFGQQLIRPCPSTASIPIARPSDRSNFLENEAKQKLNINMKQINKICHPINPRSQDPFLCFSSSRFHFGNERTKHSANSSWWLNIHAAGITWKNKNPQLVSDFNERGTMGNETLYETFMSMAYLPFSGFCKAGEFGYIHTIQPELVVPTRKIIGCSMNTYPIDM